MTRFITEDFMLSNETAKKLYHNYARQQPIIDYHCHLRAQDIYENRPLRNLTDLWLSDHYKWRAMRLNGIPEERITGQADDYSKFLAYAQTLPYAIGNPLYHWSHLELYNYFGITEPVSADSAQEIWDGVNRQLAGGMYTPRQIILNSNVYAICTSDDPADTLHYHLALAAEKDFPVKVLPTFRPDQVLCVEKSTWQDYISRLSQAAGYPVGDWESLLQALTDRVEAFARAGCVTADIGVEDVPFRLADEKTVARIFQKALSGEVLDKTEVEQYQTRLLLWLGRTCTERGWPLQLHVNAMRSQNTGAVQRLGEGTGYDSVSDHSIANKLSALMDTLEQDGQLPKMILFSLNDADNMVIATMLGNFPGDGIPSKIQMGPPWWFQDHADGMEKHLRILAAEGILGRFVGMLTDSRCFLSYTRHEYFRRILCDLLGRWAEEGKYPKDLSALGMLTERICFKNAKEYFGL